VPLLGFSGDHCTAFRGIGWFLVDDFFFFVGLRGQAMPRGEVDFSDLGHVDGNRGGCQDENGNDSNKLAGYKKTKEKRLEKIGGQ